VILSAEAASKKKEKAAGKIDRKPGILLSMAESISLMTEPFPQT
jgi:hypothetical protein